MTTPERMSSLAAARRLFSALEDEEGDEQASPDGLPTIPGYTVHGTIGAGGGGTVYRATHAGSARSVAVKVLGRRLGATTASKRAWRELELLSQLHLPCLPGLIDYGEHDGHLFVVTDLVEGSTLERHCAERGLDRRERAVLLARVADAVQSVHERGVIHRDIKPSNVVIDPSGDPVLIDLGLASLIADDPMETLTTEGSPIGSPAFMAPEQARGERAAISTRTDVYGLSATAYQVLLGQTPYLLDATLHQVVRRIADEEPRDPQEIDPGLPRGLAAVMLKGVARRPEDRYATAADFAADLRRWLNREPVTARPLSMPRRVLRALGRRPLLATAAACVLMLIVALGGSLLLTRWMSMRPYAVRMTGEPGHMSDAQLLAVDGRLLGTWGPGVADAHHRVLSMRDENGGHRLAIVGFDADAENPDQRGRLCAFDVGSEGTEPYWWRGVTDKLIPSPPPGREYHGNQFSVKLVDVQDYFPARAGPEVLVVFSHNPNSLSPIQIYGLNGDLLYQFWHDGTLNAAYWWDAEGLLVLGGLNSEPSTNRETDPSGWAARLADAVPLSTYPRVVFALRPSEGIVGTTLLVADRWKDHPDIAWYRALTPIDLPEQRDWGVKMIQASPVSAASAIRVFIFVGTLRDIGIDIDRDGNMVGGPVPNDQYKTGMLNGTLPPADAWRLVDLPPLLGAGEDGP